MRIDRENLFDKSQTARKIRHLITNYSHDLERIFLRRNGGYKALAGLQLSEYFDFVRQLPYKRDRRPIEIVARPAAAIALLKRGRGIDCKKKAIMIGAYLRLKKIPYRLIGVSTRQDKEIHHVFPQARIGGEWINLDATYPEYRIGETKHVTNWEIL